MHRLDTALGEFEAGIDALESYEMEYQGEYGQGEFAGEYGQGEFSGEFGQHELAGEYGQGEWSGEFGQGEYGEFIGEYGQGEYGQGELAGEYEYAGELQGEQETVFDEVQEMELAAELLEVQSEEELEQFLGKLIKSAGKAVGGFVRSPIGKALGGALKNVAKVAIPKLAGIAGNMLVPGLGGIVGSKLGSFATKAMGLELEGMSPQDQEFEVARRLVRLSGDAVRHAVQTPAAGNPVNHAKDAVLASAVRHAPGLAGRARAQSTGGCSCGKRGGYGGTSGYGAGRPRVGYPRGYAGGGRGGGYPRGTSVGGGYGGGSGYGGGGYGGPGYGDRRRGRGFASRGTWYRQGNALVIIPGA